MACDWAITAAPGDDGAGQLTTVTVTPRQPLEAGEYDFVVSGVGVDGITLGRSLPGGFLYTVPIVVGA